MELQSVIKQKHTKYIRCSGGDSRIYYPKGGGVCNPDTFLRKRTIKIVTTINILIIILTDTVE